MLPLMRDGMGLASQEFDLGHRALGPSCQRRVSVMVEDSRMTTLPGEVRQGPHSLGSLARLSVLASSLHELLYQPSNTLKVVGAFSLL